MNLAHLHIVLNHIPSIGTVVGVALLIASRITKKDGLHKFSLGVIVSMALLLLPTYLSGNAAQRLIRSRTDIPPVLIEVHQNSAMVTLILMAITGTLAWFGLWQFRRFSRPGYWNALLTLIFSVLTAGSILRTANMGGEISHPEIRYVEMTESAEEMGWRPRVETFANNSWVWPTSETLHFIGMPLLFGVALIINMRMLGMMKSIPFHAIHRLLPLGIFGFVLNVISGMVFFIASPGMYVGNPGFVLKILFLVLSGFIFLYFTAFEQVWDLGQDKPAPFLARVLAVSGITLLLGVMYFGRMLPFLRN
jgi:hypothetical protein